MDLKRTLSLLDSTSLMVTSIIGSGIFFTTGYLLNDISSPLGVLLCWFLGGLFAVSGALTYSYPAVLFPKAGGDYIYLKEAFSPVLAFMSGWSALLANLSANIAVLAIAFSDHFLLLFPTLKYTPFYSYSFGFISIHFGISHRIFIDIFLYLYQYPGNYIRSSNPKFYNIYKDRWIITLYCTWIFVWNKGLFQFSNGRGYTQRHSFGYGSCYFFVPGLEYDYLFSRRSEGS